MPPRQTCSALTSAHGFYGREGGVSTGIYQSLNTGPGSKDDPDAVAENRQRIARHLGAQQVVTAYQTHSSIAVYIEDNPPEVINADAMVTRNSDLAIGVLTADCVPVLFQDGSLVGAAHAGWRGSLGGILENTVDLMVHHGATRENIVACLGPSLRAPAFEVQHDLIDLVVQKYPEAECFFSATAQADKWIFDHIAFVRWRLQESGMSPNKINDVGGCTLSEPKRWFSYRSSRIHNEGDYGRNLSAIVPAKA